ncbi:hypothetical protein ATKI12_5837 [Kitasatospora sp. Ki12]
MAEPSESLAGLVEAALATADPARPAVTEPAGTWTYGELDRASAELAAALAAAPGREPAVDGAGPAPVAVLLPRGAAAVAAMLACVRAGRPFLPLPPDTSSAALPDLLGVRDLVTAGPPPAWWTGPASRVHRVRREGPPAARPAVQAVAGDGTGYFLATSGTTGTPKVVRGSAAGLAHYLRWQREELALGPGDVLSNSADPWFDFSFKETLAAVVSGATVAVLTDRELLGGAHLLSWAAEHRPTMVCLLPSRLAALLGAAEQAPAELLDAAFGRLRLLLVSGEVFPTPLLARWRAVCPHATVLNLYGPTESTVIKLRHTVPPGAAVDTPTVPVGTPIPGAEALLDAGDPAELTLVSDQLALGYASGGQGSATRFGTHPDGRPLLHTGDLARRTPDGAIEIVGRADHVVKRHGVKVSLPDLEAQARTCSSVGSAVALLLPGERERIVLCCTPYGAAADGPALRRLLREHLLGRVPAAAMPDAVRVLPELPLDPRGKVDRRALAALFEPRPEPVAAHG